VRRVDVAFLLMGRSVGHTVSRPEGGNPAIDEPVGALGQLLVRGRIRCYELARDRRMHGKRCYIPRLLGDFSGLDELAI
jgi:hypothetical protein